MDISEQLRRIKTHAEGVQNDVENISFTDDEEGIGDSIRERLQGILDNVKGIEEALGVEDDEEDDGESDIDQLLHTGIWP